MAVHTRFVRWAHNLWGEKRYHPELEQAAGRTPRRRHPDSVGVNLVGILPPAANKAVQNSSSSYHVTYGVCIVFHFFDLAIY